jgi:regulator of protease activity HflC (stomatin/prohibitin superfamily)
MFGFKIITQYEKGIVFHFGRALPGIREAGLTWVNPFTSRLRKVNMQIVVAAVPGSRAWLAPQSTGTAQIGHRRHSA